jgi:hypothetical protein
VDPLGNVGAGPGPRIKRLYRANQVRVARAQIVGEVGRDRLLAGAPLDLALDRTSLQRIWVGRRYDEAEFTDPMAALVAQY